MLQLIDVFQSQNWQITYASTSLKSDFAVNLASLQIESSIIKINDKSFDTFITELNPTIVVFDRFIIEEQFGWRVSEILPNCIKILDTEDLHCLRKRRQVALKENRTFNEIDLLKSDIAKREIASILRCDLSLIISSYEMQLLKGTFRIDANLLCYVPFLLDELSNNIQLPFFQERNHFYFIGNFLHQPNADTVLYLKKDIWPLLSKKLPKAELHIYGAYPTQQILQLHNTKERFFVKGRVENVNDTVKQYKICLAPIRFGAGLKGKLIEAMQNGTPSITSSIGAEAMHQNLKWSGCIENDIIKIVTASTLLYQDKELWLTAQQNGFKIINTCYNKNDYSSHLIEVILLISRNLSHHRTQNFMGSLLQHHTLKSTKYLSQWIEAKNKNISK